MSAVSSGDDFNLGGMDRSREIKRRFVFIGNGGQHIPPDIGTPPPGLRADRNRQGSYILPINPPERELTRLAVGQQAKVSIDSRPGEQSNQSDAKVRAGVSGQRVGGVEH